MSKERKITALALAAVALVLLGLPESPGRSQGRLLLRFHHLHYRVADPGDALGDAAATFKGTRVILQGLGVGVRAGREYVLFDRAGAGNANRRRRPPMAYLEAARWLTARGASLQPATLAETSVAAPIADAVLDHIAFAADDLATAVAAIGTPVGTVNDDRAFFVLPSGTLIEIVRDTDRPDAWWCPMHPDVRAPAAGSCRLCAMALVPIPPRRLGEYRLDVTLGPRDGGGASSITLGVREPETNERVTSFIDVHERPMHLFVVSRDLAQFSHQHPEPAQPGTFVLKHSLAPGQYLLIADFLPSAGTWQLVQRVVVTPGYTGPLFAAPPELVVTPAEVIAGGLRVTMEMPAPALRRETPVSFRLAEHSSGQPVTDLEPYLGVSGHLLILNRDGTSALHAHPDGTPTSGPIVTFTPVFPASGRYKMWAQFQRQGTVITVPFVIDVPQP